MLTAQFLKNLAVKAQQLHPVVMIGHKGLTPAVHLEINAALLAHELIKIKLSAASQEQKKQMIDEIALQHQATVVQQIGHKLILYRKNED